MKKTKFRMIYAILLGVGALLAFFAIKKLQTSISMIKNGERTTATVSELISYRDNKRSTLYKPVFEFTTADNKKMHYYSNTGSRPSIWAVGETTGIIYERANPQNSMITTYFGLFGWTVILLAIAMPFIVIGGGYFMAVRYF